MPPRRLSELPSLVDDGSRAALLAHPLVDMRVVLGAGHILSRLAEDFIMEELSSACLSLGKGPFPILT